MTFISFPTGVGALASAGGYCDIDYDVERVNLARTAQHVAVLVGRGAYWRQEFTARTSGSDEARMKAFCDKIQGSAGAKILCPDLFAVGLDEPAGGTMTLREAPARGDTAIEVDAAAGAAFTLPGGRNIAVEDRLYRLTEEVTVSPGLPVTLHIHPPLRQFSLGGVTVVTERPSGRWSLISVPRAGYVGQGGVFDRRFELVEDFS